MIEHLAKCIFCGEVAEQVYVLAERAVDVCTSCLVRQEVQDVYEKKLPELHELTATRRFDEAHQVLDTMRSQHGGRDRDGWLTRSIVAHKALLYLEQGEYGKALSAYQEWAQLGFAQPSERVEHSLGRARALVADHRAGEAVAVLEATLESLEPDLLPASICLLEALAMSYAALNTPIPQRWYGVLLSAAQALNIELPNGERDAPPDRLIEHISFAAEAMRSRQSSALD